MLENLEVASDIGHLSSQILKLPPSCNSNILICVAGAMIETMLSSHIFKNFVEALVVAIVPFSSRYASIVDSSTGVLKLPPKEGHP